MRRKRIICSKSRAYTAAVPSPRSQTGRDRSHAAARATVDSVRSGSRVCLLAAAAGLRPLAPRSWLRRGAAEARSGAATGAEAARSSSVGVGGRARRGESRTPRRLRAAGRRGGREHGAEVAPYAHHGPAQPRRGGQDRLRVGARRGVALVGVLALGVVVVQQQAEGGMGLAGSPTCRTNSTIRRLAAPLFQEESASSTDIAIPRNPARRACVS